MKRTLSLILAWMLVLCAAGCSDSPSGETAAGDAASAGANTTVEETVPEETEPEYAAPELNLNGDELHILNFEDLWNMYIHIDHEELTGDALNDLVFERNRKAEEEFNFTLVEDVVVYSGWSTGFIDISDALINDIIAGTNTYDAAYMCISQRTELITNNYLVDLASVESLNLDREWWHQSLNNTLQINGKQFIASGALNLMPYDGMTSIFFNKQIHTNYGFDNYYDMVREGTWTIDKLVADCEAVATPNSDGSWTYKEDGDASYGIATHHDFPAHFLYGCGVEYITEENGEYAFTVESDRLYAAAEIISNLFDASAGISVGSSGAGATNFEVIFGAGRSIFLMDELKGGITLRDSDVDFGLLPAPKYSAEQENYVTDLTMRTMFFCIPTSNTAANETGIVIDWLTYHGYKDVVPQYYDGYLAHKGLRDEDSYEMLQIMSETMCMDIGMAYGWCTDFVTSMNSSIINRQPLASLVQSNQKRTDKIISEFISNYMN